MGGQARHHVQIPIPIITIDTTITSTSIVSHVGIEAAQRRDRVCPKAIAAARLLAPVQSALRA